MGCGPIKVRRPVFLSSPPISVLRFDVDGVARGKPGPVSTGGVLHNYSNEGFFMFSKHVGVWGPNEAQV